MYCHFQKSLENVYSRKEVNLQNLRNFFRKKDTVIGRASKVIKIYALQKERKRERHIGFCVILGAWFPRKQSHQVPTKT